MKKYKTTGCFRFFIFLIIFAPLAYFGAAYINGEDGVQKLKNLFGIEAETETPDEEEKSEELRLKEENERLKKELEELKN